MQWADSNELRGIAIVYMHSLYRAVLLYLILRVLYELAHYSALPICEATPMHGKLKCVTFCTVIFVLNIQDYANLVYA
jgi:hypothetical protein